MEADPEVVQYLLTVLAAAVPAWFAAYFGARWSLRRNRDETAFERRLKWTEGVFATLDELGRSLNLFDQDTGSLHDYWLAATGKAMIQLNLQELYASHRAMGALEEASRKNVALRGLLRHGGDSKEILTARDELVDEISHAMNVLAYDVREHLGIATSSDRRVLGARTRWRTARLQERGGENAFTEP